MVDQTVYAADSDLFHKTDHLCDQPPSKLSLISADSAEGEGTYFAPTLESYKPQPSDLASRGKSNCPYSIACLAIADRSQATDVTASFGQSNRIMSTTQQQQAEKMSRTNLYIKGLPDSFTDEKLWNLAPQVSEIKSVKAATDDDGKCRGYGFIDFISEESANEALRHIRDTYPSFTIKFAKENEKDKTNLYVTNLPKSWTTKDSDQLKTVFERFGTIQSAFVMMERSTNRTTGVGFVRYANERDAINALESIKNNPIILPECTAPVEAKFADKHNPENRRRRYPMSSVFGANGLNGMVSYPFAAAVCNGSNALGVDALNALLTFGLPAPQNAVTTSHNVWPVSGLHPLQSHKHDYSNKIAQGLYTSSVLTKMAPTNSAAGMNLTDFAVPCANPADSQLNALAAAAASAILAAPGSQQSAFLSNGMRTTGPHCAQAPNVNGNIVTVNPLSLLGAGAFSHPTDTTLIDPSGLYRYSVYGNDFYRQTQQHQQLLAAAISTFGNNPTPSPVYAPVPHELTPYLNYANNLLSPLQPHQPHPSGTTNHTGCVLSNGSAVGHVLASPLHSLLNANTTLLTAPTVSGAAAVPPTLHGPALYDPLNMYGSRAPNSTVKHVTSEVTNLTHCCSLPANQEP